MDMSIKRSVDDAWFAFWKKRGFKVIPYVSKSSVGVFEIVEV
jgi:hypothetical protein